MAKFHIATEQFIAESEIELSLQVGDRVTISDYDDSSLWAYGTVNNRAGWFPSNNVTEETNNHVVQSRKPAPPVAPKVAYNPPRSDGNAFTQNRQNLERMFGGASVGQEPQPQRTTNSHINGQRPVSEISSYAPPSSRPFSAVETTRPFHGAGQFGNNYQYTQPASPYSNPANQFNSPSSPPHNKGTGYSRNDTGVSPYPSTTSPQPGGYRPNGKPIPSLPTKPPPQFTFPPQQSFGNAPSPPRKSEPVRNYTFQFCVEALYPYTKQENEQLSFVAKEKLDIMVRPAPTDDWWHARNKAGEMGVVPKNYVKEKPQSTPVLAERLWYQYGISRVHTEDQMRSKPQECYVLRDSEAFVSIIQ